MTEKVSGRAPQSILCSLLEKEVIVCARAGQRDLRAVIVQTLSRVLCTRPLSANKQILVVAR